MAVLYIDLPPAAAPGEETPEISPSTTSTFSPPLLPQDSLLTSHSADVIVANGPREADRIFMTNETVDRLYCDTGARRERTEALAHRLDERSRRLGSKHKDGMALALDDLTMVKCVLSSLASMENAALELGTCIRQLRPWTEAEELEKTTMEEELDMMKMCVKKRTRDTEEALMTTLFQSRSLRARPTGNQRASGIFGFQFAIGQDS